MIKIPIVQLGAANSGIMIQHPKEWMVGPPLAFSNLFWLFPIFLVIRCIECSKSFKFKFFTEILAKLISVFMSAFQVGSSDLLKSRSFKSSWQSRYPSILQDSFQVSLLSQHFKSALSQAGLHAGL